MLMVLHPFKMVKIQKVRVTDNSFESSINRPSPWYQQEEQQQPRPRTELRG